MVAEKKEKRIRRTKKQIIENQIAADAELELTASLANNITNKVSVENPDAAAVEVTVSNPVSELLDLEVIALDNEFSESSPIEVLAEVEKPISDTKDSDTSAEKATKYPRLVAENTTTLLFYAPELPKLPAREFRERDYPDYIQANNTRRKTRQRGAENQDRNSERNQNTRESVAERSDEPQKVKGSTRIEAKRQRRRDGREQSRRRQIITEVEFLARRESVERTMVVRSQNGITEIAVLEDKVLAEHYVTRSSNASLIGNVYLGRVQNVLPSMEAAFVDIGRGRNAVLYSGEVDWENSEHSGGQRRIELALQTGDQVLVQVTKDPVGQKGARLTSQVSLPGRYLVFVPNGAMNGISRKLPEPERVRLKKILKEVVPEHSGVIVRTAAEGASQEQLTKDVHRLTTQWAEIQHHISESKPPLLLHSEPDLLVKIIRDVFNEDFQQLVISGSDALSTINNYLKMVAPDLIDRVEAYNEAQDVFAKYRITEQIDKALDRKVWLPSGGSLVIDRTEAMTVIDVNTGKFVGSGGNLEETVTKNNLEAAEEIVRQLRLRDIGGIIVIDFIDMVLESNRDLVLRRLVECLSRDRTKHQVAEVTSLGLVQMTRKKIGLGLSESFNEVQNNKSIDQTSQSKEGNQSRRGRKNTQNSATAAQQNTQPAARELTEDVKNAMAQIAASTIHHPVDQPLESEPQLGEASDTLSETAISADDAKAAFSIELPETKQEATTAAPASPEQLEGLNLALDSIPSQQKPARRSRRAVRSASGEISNA